MEPDGCRQEFDMISHHSCNAGDTWNTRVYDLKENKPYTGSDSLYNLSADTGKPRKSLLFGSRGEYAQISL
jgi:hypothetical protein